MIYLCKYGKPIGHPYYGITASGYSLKGNQEKKQWLLPDPKYTLGTRVYIEFEGVFKYNGIYTARDTGGAIKGK